MAGPLAGIRVIEMVGLGPCPFAAMMLADMGAEVIRIDRKPVPGAPNPFPMLGTKFDVMARGRRSLALDLKQPAAKEVVLALLDKADVVLEGFRPGVVRGLGVDDESVREVNADVVYCSISGYGQHGPLAEHPGHDINYQAWAATLEPRTRDDEPVVPRPPIADLAGGE